MLELRWMIMLKMSVPGGRLGLFLFLLLFSVPFSKGHSDTRGPLELLNCSGSLLVAGSKGSGFSPRRATKKKPNVRAHVPYSNTPTVQLDNPFGDTDRKRTAVRRLAFFCCGLD